MMWEGLKRTIHGLWPGTNKIGEGCRRKGGYDELYMNGAIYIQIFNIID